MASEDTAQVWAFPKRDSRTAPTFLGRMTKAKAIAAAEKALRGRYEAVEAWDMGLTSMHSPACFRATAHSSTGPWAPDDWVPSRTHIDRLLVDEVSDGPCTIKELRNMLAEKMDFEEDENLSAQTVRRYLKRLGAERVGDKGRAVLWGMPS